MLSARFRDILFDESVTHKVRLPHDLQTCNASIEPRLLMRINSKLNIFEGTAGPAMSTQMWRHLRNASLNVILPKT